MENFQALLHICFDINRFFYAIRSYIFITRTLSDQKVKNIPIDALNIWIFAALSVIVKSKLKIMTRMLFQSNFISDYYIIQSIQIGIRLKLD